MAQKKVLVTGVAADVVATLTSDRVAPEALEHIARPLTPPTFPVPSVGRIVWFRYKDTIEPAIVRGVEDPTNPRSRVDLVIFTSDDVGRVVFGYNVEYHETKDGCWSWPEFQPPLPLKEG